MSEHRIYEQQPNYAKYLEVSKYCFPGGYANNPLISIIQTDNSLMPIPNNKFSNEDFGICAHLLVANGNVIDRKPVNCVKMYASSRKVLYGTTSGSLVSCDISNSFSPSKVNGLNKTASIRAMVFKKDESYLLTGDGNGTVHYFDSFIKVKSSIQLHNDTITDISFSINDSKFATSSDDKISKIIDFNTGLEDITFTQHLSDVKTCDWNPYRNLIASGGKDFIINIWDPSSGEVISSLQHMHKNSINRLRFNKNGNWLLSASKDHLLKLIDIRMLKELQTFKGHETAVNTMVWHPIYEDVFCSAGEDQNIIFWKVGQNKSFINKNAHGKEIYDLCFNKTGTLLASGSNDTILKFWGRNKCENMF